MNPLSALDPKTAHLVEASRDPTASLQERHEAFTRLVQRSQHVVFALALSSLREVEEAKDAAQDAFGTAWRRLHQLRDPNAFDPWLKAIVLRECLRRRRQERSVSHPIPAIDDARAEADGLDYEQLIAAALDELPNGERDVIVLFYFLGCTQPQIARLLRLKPGTVGKRLHSARLRIRGRLPSAIRGEFVRLTPSTGFAARVRRGLLDEYVGAYRFESRPDLTVTIAREGDSLISDAAGQRHVLVSLGEHVLATRHYDGEGRFGRNGTGEVTHFVYYEFGRRLGVAHRIRES